MTSLPNSKKLRITTPAKQDLQQVAQYTQQTWGTKQKVKYMSKLRCGFDDIRINSSIGKHYNSVDSRLLAHPCLKHIIFYRIVSDEIRVIRVLHQSMDFEQHLHRLSYL